MWKGEWEEEGRREGEGVRGGWERGEGDVSVSLLVFLASSPSSSIIPPFIFFPPAPQLSSRHGIKNPRMESEWEMGFV